MSELPPDPPPVDIAEVNATAEALMAIIKMHNAMRRAGSDKSLRLLEELGALAHVCAAVLAGAEFERKAYDYFRGAIIGTVTLLSLTSARASADKARERGDPIVPLWLQFRPPHIVLDERHFRELVSGRAVEIHDPATGEHVHAILSDIGFDRMMTTLLEVMNARQTSPP